MHVYSVVRSEYLKRYYWGFLLPEVHVQTKMKTYIYIFGLSVVACYIFLNTLRGYYFFAQDGPMVFIQEQELWHSLTLCTVCMCPLVPQ